MRPNKTYFFLFFLFFIFILTSKAGYAFDPDESFLSKATIELTNQKSSTNRITTVTYTDHSRIVILNETAFQTYGFLGDGSATDPYTIEGLNITETSEFNCITIRDIHANVTIQDNYLDGGSNSECCIKLENVSNVKITQNQILNAQTGISLYLWNGLKNNKSLIQTNTINLLGYMNAQGEFASTTGIRVYGDDNIIEGNQIYHASTGIYSEGNRNSFSNNLIFNCTSLGIRLPGGGGDYDRANPSTNNSIKWNDFVWNGDTAAGQAYADEECVSTNFAGNYWDDLTYPDADTDGIVDNPYVIPHGIDGENFTDDSPRTTPNNLVTSSLHYFNRPRIISLPTCSLFVDESTLSKVVTIEWSPVTDSKGHDIKYSVFYGEDDWVAIAENITENKCDWDTRDLQSSGRMCCTALKVVAICSDGLTAKFQTDGIYAVENEPEMIRWELPIFCVTLCALAVITRKKRS